MSAQHCQPDAASVPVNLKLRVGSYELEMALAVPATVIRPQAVLPALQALADAIVGAAERELDGTGRSVSCRSGCAACCRQAVSISPIEAWHIRDLVEAMPEPRRGVIKQRFADAAERAREAGLYAPLMDPAGLSAIQRQGMALDYLALGIPCPFLEAETCSIYADRPLACREYLVTSPPERCATPGTGDLEPVDVPKLSRALSRASAGHVPAARRPVLSLALDWVAAQPADLPLRSGPDWVRDILGHAASVPPPAKDDAGASGEVALPMPPGKVSDVDMLPTFRAYTEATVARAIAQSMAEGKPPSCRAGCSACCRHQMPVSTTEARRIAAIVETMPEPRRSAVRARFADADRRIAAWNTATGEGMGLNNRRMDADDRLASYFSLGISCPLLENEQCSIYEERPLVCREYLVTSPAENCARLEEPGVVVEAVPRAFTPVALAHLLSDDSPPVPSRVLLAHALRWVAEHPQEAAPRRTAEEWLSRFFDRLRQVDELAEQPRPTHPTRSAQDTGAPAAPPDDGPLRLDVPARPVPVRDMLPAFRAITDVAVQRAIAQGEARGTHVSCAVGCSACCRQLVPVGPVEAHTIAGLVRDLPEPRRSVVRARFAAAEARLAEWHRRPDLEDVDRPRGTSAYQLGFEYFRLGIACPFLEEDICSIYSARPLACREHLVTSPAAHCAQADGPDSPIEVVPSADAARALMLLEEATDTAPQRTPLTLSLSRAARDPARAEHQPGRIWVERFVARLRGLR